MNNENSYFQSSDLPLITTIALFYPIDSIDRRNPQRIVFLFKREQSLDQFIEAYWKKQIKIEPQAYFNQLSIIKTRIYSGV
jgi:hypothetical protein